MSAIHVFPDKLPCDTGGSFVVIMAEPLPAKEEHYSLTFRGEVTKKRISGKAVPIDTKTLMCTVGGFGEPEEAKVDVVGAAGASRVRRFKVSFLTRFQLVCSFLPESTPLQAPVAVARCLPRENENKETMDEELAEFCQRTMPTDLSYSKFFGVALEEHMGSHATLLHFAAERGLMRFAAHLLAASGGAWEALHTPNKEGNTPRQIAEKMNNKDMRELFDEYKDIAADNAVPLVDYVNVDDMKIDPVRQNESRRRQEPTKDTKTRSLLADIVVKWKSYAGPKAKRTNILRHFTMRRKKSKEKAGIKATSDKFRSKRKVMISESTVTKAEFSTRPLPSPPMSEDDSNDSDQPNYEPIDFTTERETAKVFQDDYLKPTSCTSRATRHYDPKVNDPKDALRLLRGQEVHVVGEAGDPHWMTAIVNGRKGSVPKFAIEIATKPKKTAITIDDDDIPDIPNVFGCHPSEETQELFVATHHWKPERQGDLEISPGEVVAVIEKNENKWWKVRLLENQEEGIVPETYLRKQQPHEASVKPPSTRTLRSDLRSETEESDWIPPPPPIDKPDLSAMPSYNVLSRRGRQQGRRENIAPETYVKKQQRQNAFVRSPNTTTIGSNTSKEIEDNGWVPTPSPIEKPVLSPSDGQSYNTLSMHDLGHSQESSTSASSTDSGLGPLSTRCFTERLNSELKTRGMQQGKERLHPWKTTATEVSLLPVPQTFSNERRSKREDAFLPIPKSPVGPSRSSSPDDFPPLPPSVRTSWKPLSRPTVPSNEPKHRVPSTAKPPPSTVPKRLQKYKCLWEFEPQDDNDLFLRAGDVVTVTGKHNNDWWMGVCRGKKGTFPAVYVTKIEQ